MSLLQSCAMSTSLLSQAICMVPLTNNATFTPVKIGFSCHPFSFRPTTVSVCNFGKFCRSARSITVRAESEAEGISEGNEEISEDSAVAVEFQEKPERKQRIKLGDIMGILNRNPIEASESQRKTPDIRVGDIVEIKLDLPDNNGYERFKGIVISKQNAGIHTTIRVRKILADVGVEIVLSVYSPSPNIKEIKVVNHRKVRRARLYYLRDKLPRFSTFK